MSEDTKKKENLSWQQGQGFLGISKNLEPLLGSILLLIEEEKKRTNEKIKQTKETIELLKKHNIK